MDRIRISVERTPEMASSDAFQVYGDGGTGVIDWAHPLSPRRQPLWPDARGPAGHLVDPHCLAVHLDADCSEPGAATFDTPPVVFGRFQYAVVLEDAVGNAGQSGPCVQEAVVSSAPPPPNDLRAVAHDPETQRLTLSFTPSERLVG